MKAKKLFAGYYTLGRFDIVQKRGRGFPGWQALWCLYLDHGAYKEEVAKFPTLRAAVEHIGRMKGR